MEGLPWGKPCILKFGMQEACRQGGSFSSPPHGLFEFVYVLVCCFYFSGGVSEDCARSAAVHGEVFQGADVLVSRVQLHPSVGCSF